MRILFGIQGTGNGHIVRSREVVRHLKSKGHDVRIIFSGRKPVLLKEFTDLEPSRYLQGLTFSTCEGRIRYFKSVLHLNIFRLYRDIYSFDASDLDLVITDYEPISARIASRRHLPSIGIGHQYAFCYRIPVAGDNFFTKWMLLNFAPAQYPLGLHWHHFSQPILPPIVPRSAKRSKAPKMEKILVYLPFESLPEIRALFRAVKTHHFFIYTTIEHAEDDGNLHLRPISRSSLLLDLADCSGVISNAGFELAGEALHLGIKILAKPLSGQLEQASNAMALSALGWGSVMKDLEQKAVEEWLGKPQNEPAGYPDTAKMIADWIEDGNWEDIEGLSQKAWSKTRFGTPLSL